MSLAEGITRNAFLGGRVSALQPEKGFRSGIDAVLLAASVPATAGDHVLELGCGVGVASLCLAARVDGVHLTGVEVQPEYADLARQNAAEAKADFTVHTGDLTALPEPVRLEQFNYVMANPPYYAPGSRHQAQDAGRETALGEEATALADWVRVAAKRLRPKGEAIFIQRTDRLGDMVAAMQSHLGSIRIQPLVAREGRDSHLFLIRGKKNGRSPLRLHSPLVMHDGPTHLRDGIDYQSWAIGVLKDGLPLPWIAS